MNMTSQELQIRACWALNCAVAMGDVTGHDLKPEVILLDRAKMFLKLLDQVKAVIQPPMTPIVGKGKVEKQEAAKEEAEHDAGNELGEIN